MEKKNPPSQIQTDTVVDEVDQPDFVLETEDTTVNADEQRSSSAPQATISASKIIDIDCETPPDNPDIISGFRLVDMTILSNVFRTLSYP